MKKRYARILAATLSAAMVFTSAPSTVFNTGVIEAKADYTDPATLATDLGAAITAAIAADEFEVDYNNSTTAQGFANAIAAKLTTNSGDPCAIAANGSDDVTVTAAVATNGTNHACGEYDVVFTATTSTSNLSANSSTIKLKIVPGTGKTAYTKQGYLSMVENYAFKKAFTTQANTKALVQTALSDATNLAAVKASGIVISSASVDGDNKPGTFSAAVNVTVDTSKVAPADEAMHTAMSGAIATTINTIVIDKAVKTGVKGLPATAEYVYAKDATDVGTDKLINWKTELGANASSDISGSTDTTGVLAVTTSSPATTWYADTASRSALLAAVPTAAGTVVPMTFFITVSDADTYDYSDIGTVENGAIKKVVNVKVTKSDLTYGTEVKTLPTALYTYGDDAVKLGGATKDDYKIVNAPKDLTKIVSGTTTVTVESVDSFSRDVYDIDTFISTESGSREWSYNSSTGKFSIDITISASPKQLQASDIVWPTKVANGGVITAGDVLADVELEETVSSKYGTFTLSKSSGTTASVDDTKYTLTFTPKSGVAAVKSVSDTVGVTAVGPGTAFSKEFAVTVAKKSISSKNIAIRTTGLAKSYAYGTTYGDILNDIVTTAGTYDMSETDGTWATKEGDSKVLSVGKNTVTLVYTLKESKTQGIDGDKASIEFPVSVEVIKPVYELSTAETHVVNTNAATPLTATADWKTGTAPAGGVLNPGAQLTITEAAWYDAKTNQVVYGTRKTDGTIPTLPIDNSKMASESYYCVVNYKINDGLATDVVDAWKSVIGDGVLKSNVCKVTVTNMSIETINVPVSLVYGKINDTVDMTVPTPGTDYEIESVKWQCVTADGKTTVDMESKIAGGKSIATIPTTLNAGDYKAVATVTATSAKYAKDTAVFEEPFTVDKATLAKADFDFEAITFEKEAKIIKFGTKISEIKYTAAKNAEKYGSYEYINDQIPYTTTDATDSFDFVKFIPNAETKNNYDNWDAGQDIVEIDGITVEKGEIVITANDITVEVGAKVYATDITAKVDGLVGTDTLNQLGIKLSYDLGTVDTTKAGVNAGVLKVTAKCGDQVDDKIDNASYTVKVVPGNVIVKAAAPVVTPTPTPAPATVAKSANVKAVKSTVTAKVGASKTTQVKMAAAAKAQIKSVKWTTSNKKVAKLPKTISKKALKVKVKGLKKGKATIKAVVTFKDGSKKTIKFTVKVK